MPTAFLGSLSGAFFIGNMLGKLAFGKIADRIGSFKVFVVSEALMALLLIALSAVKSTYALAGVSILLGAVTKGTVPVINTIVVGSVPDPNLCGKAFGISSFFNGIAGVLSPMLFGALVDRLGIASVFHASAAFACLAILPFSISKLGGR